ncbi:hypothetical protein PAXRUDRAFT_162383, partial [Paxillus rubicundulus Ve08.2h10]
DFQHGGHHVYFEDHHMIAIKQNISFKRWEGLVLGPGGSRIEGEKGKWSDSNQHADLKDHAITNVPKPPPDPSVTMEPPITPGNIEMMPLNSLDPLGSNFEQPPPMETLRHLTHQ